MPDLPQVVPGDRELYRQQVREIEQARSKERQKKQAAEAKSTSKSKSEASASASKVGSEFESESKPELRTKARSVAPPEPVEDEELVDMEHNIDLFDAKEEL